MKFSRIISITAFMMLVVSLAPMTRSAQDSASHANVSNPVKPTPESQAHAKEIYNIDCLMCHGARGDGKTDLARDMQLDLKDWTDPTTLGSKTDGQLFDFIRNGNSQMPPESLGRAPDDVVWNLVIYIRSFSKSQ